MRKFLFLVSTVTTLLAQTLHYELHSDGDKIGTMTVSSDGTSYYQTTLAFCIQAYFTQYCYSYDEQFQFNNESISLLNITEIDNGEQTVITAREKGIFLVYDNNMQINMSKITTFPFDINLTDIKQKPISITTFEPGLGIIVNETYSYIKDVICKNNICHEIKKESDLNSDIEILIINDQGTIIKITNELFQAILVNQ